MAAFFFFQPRGKLQQADFSINFDQANMHINVPKTSALVCSEKQKPFFLRMQIHPTACVYKDVKGKQRSRVSSNPDLKQGVDCGTGFTVRE